MFSSSNGSGAAQLRIGNFQSGYPDPDGITAAVQGLAGGLAREGHAVTIYGCGNPKWLADQPVRQNLETVLETRSGRNPFHVPAALRQRIARNEDRLDLLLIHGMFNPPNVQIARAARAGQIPYIVYSHCPFHPALLRKHRWRKKIYGMLFERPQLRRALGVQVFCPTQKAYLRQYGVATECMVLPNGLDPECVPPVTSETSDLAGDPKFLFLGRLDIYHKGLDILIQAFAMALREQLIPPGSSLTLVGPGQDERDKLIRLAARAGVAANVLIRPPVYGIAKWSLLRSCDVFTLCSRYEGFAMAGLEAMFASRPLLLSTETGIPSWIRDAECAYIVSPTVESIRDGLAEAVRNRQHWRRMGISSFTFATNHLTWDMIAKQAAIRFQALLAERSRPFAEPIAG